MNVSLFFFSYLPLVDASDGNGILTKATVPIYATGVLTCYNQVGEGPAHIRPRNTEPDLSPQQSGVSSSFAGRGS